ncbi:MAG TPA: xanthine dehydrogenase family protein molybdopterin-binding subunit [Nitrososphaerales archaeon]|nr:xanthine dehydrogenase family protein molybdopterin-binding subunit [Nitrososphaerales archaeon]
MSALTSLEKEEREGYSVIGHRVPKYDAIQKVTGRADYMFDLKLPGMLHGKILRSRHPHARILKIDKSRAEALPGVVAVITAADTPRIKFGFMKDNLPLKDKKVLSYRDEVAAVAAVDEETASKAIELIDVDYEQLTPLFDPLEAMKTGARPLHDGSGSNIVNLPFKFKHGDPDEVFARSDVVSVENTFRLHFMTHSALGTMGVLASYSPDGSLTVWSNTQAPFMFQREMGEALGLPAEKVRVIQPYIGGSFGRGMDLYPVDVIAALLSMKTRRPVKILFSREEDLSYSPTRQPAIIKMRTGASRVGKLLARKVEVVLDVGAYVSWGAFDARVMMATSTGQYRIENVEFVAQPVYTNNPYSGTMRGAGNPQINFAMESQMDILAERLGIDPLDFRLRNVNRPGDVTTQGMKIGTCSMEETLRVAAREIGWKGWHKAGKNRGIGFSTLFHVAGGARVYRSDGCGATIRIDDFGKVTVLTGSSEIGTGSDTSIAQIVAEELGIPLSRVELVNTDTSVKPWDVGIHASRMTFVGGNAALLAARGAKDQLLRLAADELGGEPSDMAIEDGLVFSRANPTKSLDYSKLVRRSHFREGGTMVTSSAFFDPPTEMADPETQMGNISAAYGFGTQAVMVQADPETGKLEVLKVVAVHDAGRILNPIGAEGQVEGGVLMSLSYALNEELLLEEGAVLNPSFADYKLLTIGETPEIKVIFVGEPDPAGPFGAKGVGEHGCIPTAAAVANAVYDALGTRLCELPLLPERVLRATREKAEAESMAASKKD